MVLGRSKSLPGEVRGWAPSDGERRAGSLVVHLLRTLVTLCSMWSVAPKIV